ncbi:adenosylcobinamide-phosphate synthase CbiB [Natronomonas amylolytica]|uniref:adenosylcobinamide-phosphate synthase CbiB n=1 Tax=Natronomonas amylolytica TaxID=3108498 RepID=UPI00300AC42C
MSTAGLAVVIAAALALALDWTMREPPAEYHPVTLFGRIIESVDREYRRPRLAGALLALLLPAAAALAVYGLLWVMPPIVTGVVAGLLLWSMSSFRLLLDIVGRAIEESETDIESAREVLPALVGRDVGELSSDLVRSAAVESAAENLSDGLVAPLLAFGALAVVSLPAAGAAAAYVKAVNTMDSMLGYPGAFGWGSARLDDLVMFVPARVTALLLALVMGAPDAWWRARRYARKTDSPNAGWPMGTMAAALNVRLEKRGVYTLNEVADYPSVADGDDALVAVTRVGLVSYTLVALVGVIRWL